MLRRGYSLYGNKKKGGIDILSAKLSTVQMVLIGFLIVIIIGSVLLSLPISSANGKPVMYIDALFTATTATCVTGLVTVTTASTWSIFGQAVILCLIQIGGLGVITVLFAFMLLCGKKIGIEDRLLIMDSFNLNSIAGLAKFIKKVVIGSLVVEIVGAILYMIVFVPRFGVKGIWISIFNSVSAFCNAGMDIIPGAGISEYITDPIVNIVTCALIILGGLGFVVWWDVIKVCKNKRTRKFRFLSLHSKIVLVTTAILILFGAVSIFVFEYANTETIGNFSIFEKIQASLFQSVTTRTAGFALLSQKSLALPSIIICMFLMFVGGSPVGTAGGTKTTTLFVIIATAMSTVKGKRSAGLFHRKISDKAIRKAVLVILMSFILLFVATILLSWLTSADFADILYETISATATVGLSRGVTESLNSFGKIIIIVTMYLGRVGPISLALAFKGKEKGNVVESPVEEVHIG